MYHVSEAPTIDVRCDGAARAPRAARAASLVAGDDLAALLVRGARTREHHARATATSSCVASKMVSRAEGRFVDLAARRAVAARDRARPRDRQGRARRCELILRESIGHLAEGARACSSCGTGSGSSSPTRASTAATPCRAGAPPGSGPWALLLPGGTRRLRRAHPRARLAERSGASHRRRHQRLVRPALPPGHRGRGHRRLGAAAAVGSARRARTSSAARSSTRSPRSPIRSPPPPISSPARPPSGGPRVLVRGLAFSDRRALGASELLRRREEDLYA